jgi:hypothetical protein
MRATRLRDVSLVLLYACLVTARLVHRGARKAASAALAQQAARHPGQAMELVRLIGARFHAAGAASAGANSEDSGTFMLTMRVRHYDAPAYTAQRVHAIVRVLQPPPHPPGDDRVSTLIASAGSPNKYRLVSFTDAGPARDDGDCVAGNGVYARAFTPAGRLRVQWAKPAAVSTTAAAAADAAAPGCGAMLSCAAIAASQPPRVEFSRHPLRGGWYTLLLVDPDAPDPRAPSCEQWLHWMVTDIKVEDGGHPHARGWLASGRTVVPYNRPTPPVGTHRYVLLLLHQRAPLRGRVWAPRSRCKFDVKAFGAAHHMGTVPAALQWFRAKKC